MGIKFKIEIENITKYTKLLRNFYYRASFPFLYVLFLESLLFLLLILLGNYRDMELLLPSILAPLALLYTISEKSKKRCRRNNISILILNFKGSTASEIEEGKRVTNIIYTSISEQIAHLGLRSVQVQVIPLDVLSFKEAKEIGWIYRAQLVMWGLINKVNGMLSIKPRVYVSRIVEAEEENKYLPLEVTLELMILMPAPFETVDKLTGILAFVLGMTYFYKKKYDLAIDSFNKAVSFITDKEELAKIYFYIGMGNLFQKKLHEAHVALETAVNYTPQDKNIRQWLANVYFFIGAVFTPRTAANDRKILEEQTKQREEILKLDPNDAVAHYNLGEAYLAMGKYEDALSHFEKAVELSDHYKTAFYIHRQIGNIYYKRKMYDEAIMEYNIAVRDRPDDAQLHWFLGDTYFFQNNYDCAMIEYIKAIELSSTCVQAFRGLGWCLEKIDLKKDRYKKHKKWARRRRKAGELIDIAVKLYEGKKYKKASKFYEKSIKAWPGNIEAYFDAALSYTHIKDYDRAIERFQACVSVNPKDVESVVNIGICYFNKKDTIQTIVAFWEALKIEPELGKEMILENLSKAGVPEKLKSQFMNFFEPLIDELKKVGE